MLEIVFNQTLGSDQTVECSVQTILGYSTVGHAEQVLQSSGGVPMFGKGELTAGTAKTIDNLDRHNISRSDGFLSLRQMTVDNFVEVQKFPEVQRQPDVAKPPRIG